MIKCSLRFGDGLDDDGFLVVGGKDQ
jgi:hypothetical protein